MVFIELIFGLIILVISSEIIIRKSVKLAYLFGVSKLVIGLTIVSFGTSTPELFVSIKSLFLKHEDICTGNVIGSNIINISLILGLTALIYPIKINKNSIKFQWFIMFISTILFVLFIIDGNFVFWEGIIFVISLISFNLYSIIKSRKNTKKENLKDNIKSPKIEYKSIFISIILILIGIIGLVLGADLFVKGTVLLAQKLNISDYTISATIVAFGTSLPELATSCVAAFKKHSDISIGNLIGSNIFNLLGIVGISSVFHPIKININILNGDIYWLIGVSFLILPMLLINKKIGLFKSLILLCVYILYTIYLLK